MTKRILFVDEDQLRNGSTVSLEYLVRGFSSRGYEVLVLTWKKELQTKSTLMALAQLLDGRMYLVSTITMCLHFTYTMSPFSWRGIRTIVKDIIKFFVGIAIILKVIKTYRPDLVYVNEYSVVQASVAAYLAGVPAVIHVRSLLLKGAFGLRRRLTSRLILFCNQAVFAITKREAEQLRPKLREKNKIKIVGEFFSNAHIDSVHVNRHRELFGLPADKKIVTMLGGIREIKGTIDFLRAAQLVMSKHDNTVFVIAGKGYRNGLLHEREYFDECMKVVEILRERGLIYMLGEITNPLELIATSDILVSPSPQTHFSRPVIEAWGFTKPVIAARTDHMQDLINDGVNGLLIPVGDHDALANYLCLLLDNSELCQRLGREGRKKTDAEFDADTNLQRIVDTCDSMSFIRR